MKGLIDNKNNREPYSDTENTPRKQPPLVSPRKWETSTEIPYWWRVTALIWVVLLIGWSKFVTQHNQSESGWRYVIIMEFLYSFLRRHFAGKPVAASRNVGCFLRLHGKRTVSKQTWSQPCFHQRLLIVVFFWPTLSRALSGIDHVNLEEYTVHVVAGVLKLFFRQLSVPVITSDFYMDFIRTAGECKKITFYCCFFSLRNPRCFKG